jgi:hypothetical protein
VVGKFKFIGSSAATGDGALSVFHMRQVNLQQAQGATTSNVDAKKMETKNIQQAGFPDGHPL